MPNAESHSLSVDLTQILESLENKFKGSEENEARDPYYNPQMQGLPTVDRVPSVLRQQNISAYSPTTVSIGPLHRETKHLEAMEAVKLSYMSSLLQRTAMLKAVEGKKSLCAYAMLKLGKRVKTCYEPARLDPKRENAWLAEVMLIDGCFIIELLYRFNVTDTYDPILWNPFKYYAVKRDLLLLENQIPFFVLQKLFHLTVGEEFKQESIQKWILSFFGDMMGLVNDEREKKKKVSMIRDPHHILHLFHIYYVSGNDHEDESGFTYKERITINYRATELRLGGVELKAGKQTNLFDIQFNKAFSCSSCSFLFRKGHLEIPPFTISDSTESFLKNLIAFELSCPYVGNYFTSLAFLMDLLIDTPEDVKLLEKAGIIHNSLGSREEVAQLFNGICKNATPNAFRYRRQYKQAIDFCKPWRRSTGKLRHFYFGNPWLGISVIAAIIIFGLTFTSTLYTILSYYH